MNWQHCKRLIAFELKHTPLYYFALNILIAALFGWFYAQVLPENLLEDKPTMVVDFLFVLAITVNAYLLRPYSFYIREVKSKFYVAPIQILLRQMPITKKTIIVSRFMTTFMFSTIASIIFLSVFFFFLPTDQANTLFPNVISFSLVWILLALAGSGAVAASEPGDYMTKRIIVLWWVVILYVLIVGLLMIRFITGRFLMEWIVIGAAEMPVLFPVLVLLFSMIVVRLWAMYMKYYLNKTAYHV